MLQVEHTKIGVIQRMIKISKDKINSEMRCFWFNREGEEKHSSKSTFDTALNQQKKHSPNHNFGTPQFIQHTQMLIKNPSTNILQ